MPPRFSGDPVHFEAQTLTKQRERRESIVSGRWHLWVSAVGTCIALEGHRGPGQYLQRGDDVWAAWAGSGSGLRGQAGCGWLRCSGECWPCTAWRSESVPACKAHRCHVCACLLLCVYTCPAVHARVSPLPGAVRVLGVPHVPAPATPGRALCRSPPACQPPSSLTPAIVGPCPSCPSLHPTLPAGHGHDLGVPLPAEYQILCGNQAPGFIIDIHTGKPIGE